MSYFQYTIEDYRILFEAFDNALDDESVSRTDFLISRGILKTLLELLKEDWTDLTDKDSCIINGEAHSYIISFLDFQVAKFDERLQDTKENLLIIKYSSYIKLLDKARRQIMYKKHLNI